MKSKNIAAVAFAILGLYAILSSVSIFQGLVTISFLQQEFEGKTAVIVLAYLFPVTLLVGSAVFLILQRFRLAAWVTFDAQELDSEQSEKELPDLAFAILGLYLVITTIPSLGSLAGQLITMKASPNFEEFTPALRANIGRYLGSLAEFVIGGYLFINAREVAGWWRRRGLKPATERSSTSHSCPECDSPFDVGDYRDLPAGRRCSNCKSEIPDSAYE